MARLPKRTDSQKTGEAAQSLLDLILTMFCNVVPVPQGRDLGVDFICELMQDNEPTGKAFNVQCKGTLKSIEENSKIRIPISVTTLNYWLKQPNPTFLVLVDLKKCICYWSYPKAFIESISNNWEKQDKVTIPVSKKDFFNQDSKSLPARMMSIINQSSSEKPKPRHYIETLKIYNSSIIIDGIFLSKCILSNRALYSKMYPHKSLGIPSIYAVINQLLKWSRFSSEHQVFCHLVRPNPKHLHLRGIRYPEEPEDYDLYDNSPRFDPAPNNRKKEVRKRDCMCLVNDFEAEDFVWEEVESLVYRFVDVENLLLVADDAAYFPLFEKIEAKGTSLLLGQDSNFRPDNFGSNRYIPQLKWFDITYPIARAMGLEREEW